VRLRARSLPGLLMILGVLLVAARARAQENYTFTVAGLGGIGGSLDAGPGDKLDRLALQLNCSLVTDPKTHVGFRLGRVDLDVPGGFAGLTGADLEYVNVAGEYRYSHSFYESGIYAGLGAYRLTGQRLLGGSSDQTAPGAVLGLTGEFGLSRHFGLLLELSGHWANLDAAQTYLFAHLGIAYHF
jgi:hypothetical protein